MSKPVTYKWLLKNRYDGLYHDGDCACELNDLHPCGMEVSEIRGHCQPGYKKFAQEDGELGLSEIIKGDWYICKERKL